MVFYRSAEWRQLNYRVKDRPCRCQCQLCHHPYPSRPAEVEAYRPPGALNRGYMGGRAEYAQIGPRMRGNNNRDLRPAPSADGSATAENDEAHRCPRTLIIDDRLIERAGSGRKPLGLNWLPVEYKQRKDYWTKYEAIPIGVLRFIKLEEAEQLLAKSAPGGPTDP